MTGTVRLDAGTPAATGQAPFKQVLTHGFIVKPDGTEVYSGTFKSDPSLDPRAIDFTNTAGEAAGTDWAGIWRLDGTTLTIADNAPDPSRPRPAEFAAPAGSGYIMIVFERAD